MLLIVGPLCFQVCDDSIMIISCLTAWLRVADFYSDGRCQISDFALISNYCDYRQNYNGNAVVNTCNL